MFQKRAICDLFQYDYILRICNMSTSRIAAAPRYTNNCPVYKILFIYLVTTCVKFWVFPDRLPLTQTENNDGEYNIRYSVRPNRRLRNTEIYLRIRVSVLYLLTIFQGIAYMLSYIFVKDIELNIVCRFFFFFFVEYRFT